MPASPARQTSSSFNGFRDRHAVRDDASQHRPAPVLAGLDIDLADAASRSRWIAMPRLYNRVIAELDDEAFGLFSDRCGRAASNSCAAACWRIRPSPTEGLDRARRFLPSCCPTWGQSNAVATGPNCGSPNRPLTAARTTRPGSAFEMAAAPAPQPVVLAGRARAGLDSVDSRSSRQPTPTTTPGHTERSLRRRPAPTARFNATSSNLPIRRDEAAWPFLEGAPGRISMLYRRDRAPSSRVRDLIRDALPASLSQDEGGDRLHMSPRTLHRRLDEEGASFRSIKEACAATSPWPAFQDPPAHRPAADLGYADTSAFYRAFTSWTGMSPDPKQLCASVGIRPPPCQTDRPHARPSCPPPLTKT